MSALFECVFSSWFPWCVQLFESCRDFCIVQVHCDEYVYRTPIPKHAHKYTNVKVLRTQDKHTQLSNFAQLCCNAIYTNALLTLTYWSDDTNPQEYIDTHSRLTGYLHPCELDNCIVNLYISLRCVWITRSSGSYRFESRGDDCTCNR